MRGCGANRLATKEKSRSLSTGVEESCSEKVEVDEQTRDILSQDFVLVSQVLPCCVLLFGRTCCIPQAKLVIMK